MTNSDYTTLERNYAVACQDCNRLSATNRALYAELLSLTDQVASVIHAFQKGATVAQVDSARRLEHELIQARRLLNGGR